MTLKCIDVKSHKNLYLATSLFELTFLKIIQCIIINVCIFGNRSIPSTLGKGTSNVRPGLQAGESTICAQSIGTETTSSISIHLKSVRMDFH